MKKKVQSYLYSLLSFSFMANAFAEESNININKIDDIERIIVVGQQESYLNTGVSSATKVLADPLDIPLTVNIINDVFLHDLRAKTLADAYGYSTGMSTSGTSAEKFTLRGLPSSLSSVQVNGLPGLISRNGSPTTVNVERVEILKGPASVLYGQLEPGGLINIVTKKPQEESMINVDISMQSYQSDTSKLGDDNGITTTLDATGALTANKKWLYRFIASSESIDSFRDDVEYDNVYLFPTLTYLASDNTELTFGLEFANEKGSADNGLFAVNNNINHIAPINIYYQEKNDYDNDQGLVSFATLTSEFNDTFDFSANWRSVWHEDERYLHENNKVNDADNFTEGTLKRSLRHQLNKREYHFVDVNTHGSFSFGSIDHELLIGINAGYEKRDYERKIYKGEILSGDLNILIPQTGNVEYGAINNGTERITELWNYGLYLQDTMYLNEQWVVMGGLRYDKQDVDFIEKNKNVTASQSSDVLVPMLGVVYKITDKSSIYTSYGESYNPNSVEKKDISEDAFDPEIGKQIELGVKTSLFDEKANISLAYFNITKDNIVEKNTEGEYELLGKIESKGIEAELLAMPIDNWQMKMGYAYVDSIVLKSPKETIQGNHVQFVPEHDLYFWSRYNLTEAFYQGIIGLSLGVNYESSRYTGTDSTSRVKIPSYIKVDMGLHYETSAYELSLNVENILNENYFDGGTKDYRIYPGEPRKITLGVSLFF